jgi:chromosome segregation ATPase
MVHQTFLLTVALVSYSLLSLTLVMKALGDPKTQHVNYRDSNLTRILQPSLSGNARMAIVFCVSPSELYLEETRSTLKFATRAKKVKTRPKVNKIMDDKSKIKALERELEAAKLELVSAGAANVKDLERQVAMSSKEAVAHKAKMGRLMSIILNLNHGIFKTSKGDQKLSMTLVAAKRRLSAGGTPSGTASDDCVDKVSVPATVPRPDKRRKDASSNPLPHALQLNLFQEALASKSDALEAEREKVKQAEEALRAATARAEGAEKELGASKAEVSHLSTQLTSLRPVLEKAFVDQQADQAKLQELQSKYDAEAKERQVLQQVMEEARKKAEELELRNAELSASLERETGRYESDMKELNDQLESLRQTHEATQLHVETLQGDLAKSQEENGVLCDANSSLEAARVLCESQLGDVSSMKTILEEQNKSLEELRDREEQAFEDEKARLDAEVTALSRSKEELEEQCKTLQDELSTLSAANKLLVCEVEALKTDKSSLEATMCQKVGALDDQATELEATKLRLEETIQNSSKAIADLETKVAEKDEEVASVRTTLSQAQDELSSLSQSLKMSKEQCTSLSTEKDSIRAELEEASKQLIRSSEVNDEQTAVIESLRSSLADLEAKESSTASCLQTTAHERDDAISSLALVRSEVDQISREKEEVWVECESRLVSAEEQHAQLTSDYMSVQECLLSNQASLEKTTQAMLSHQNSCEMLRAQVLELTNVNDRVNRELSECHANLHATLEQMNSDEACRLKSEQEEKDRVQAQHAEAIAALQARLSETSGELKDSHDALASLRLEFDGLTQQYDAMQISIHDGTEREAALSRKLEELQKSYDATKEEAERLQSEAVRTIGLFDNAEKERSVLLGDFQSLNSTVEELMKTQSDLQNQISTLQQELEQALSAAQNDRQALLDQAHQLKTAVESRAALQEELAKMTEAKDATSDQVAIVQAELDSVTSSWESTKELLDEAKQQISRLELLESAASQRIESFEDLAQRLQAEIDDQASRNQSLSDCLTESQSRVVELTEKLSELEREKADSRNLVSQLHEQIQQVTTETEQAKIALTESRIECDSLKHELVRSHDMLETASGQLKEKQESINELEDQIATMRNMLNERRSPVHKNESRHSHGMDGNEGAAVGQEEDDLGNEYELKLLLARANDTIGSARQREDQYVRDLEALQTQFESAKAQLEQAAISSCTSETVEKLLLDNQELEYRLQKEVSDRAAAEAEMEHRFLESKRVLIQEAESTMRNLQTELRKTKESAKQLEAEAYAGRQENQDLRERSSSSLARVTELETENERLQAAVDEAIKNQKAESMRLSIEAKAAKETEYATKQAVRDIEQKLRDSLDANARLAAEAKECKMLRVSIKSLQTELEALTNSGSGRDEAIAQLRDELQQKDQRITKLERLKFTKEQAAQLRHLKVRAQLDVLTWIRFCNSPSLAVLSRSRTQE